MTITAEELKEQQVEQQEEYVARRSGRIAQPCEVVCFRTGPRATMMCNHPLCQRVRLAIIDCWDAAINAPAGSPLEHHLSHMVKAAISRAREPQKS